MAKAVSGDAFTPATRENPPLRMSVATRSKRSNPSRCMRVRHQGGAVKYSYGASECADFEFLKNTVNIDKFLKLFDGRTNDICNVNIEIYQYTLK